VNYLRFALEADTGKTRRWGVFSLLHGDRLGTVSWYGRWRQYTFAPEPETVWNKDCLRDLAAFLEKAMSERGQGRLDQMLGQAGATP
jgi:hypothetical protein